MARLRSEALCLLEEGALPEEVDRALTEFGFPIGPFAALDLEGVPAALQERKATLADSSPRERACTIFEELALLGRLGKHAGAGFYHYDNGRAVPDPALPTLLARHSASRGIARLPIGAEEITVRCLYSLVNEAARLLDEKLAARPLDIDMIMVHGFGFPVYRGGPLFFADQIGLGGIRDRLLQFRGQLGEPHWTPAKRIEGLAAERGSFYGGSR